MLTGWRSRDTPLHSHAEWLGRIDRKNRQPGTSAPTLAAAWSGPLEMFSALREQGELHQLRIDEVIAEAQSRFDDYSGPRNHDLVVRGRLPHSDRVVVCIEAKAGEALGDTVADARREAVAAKAKSPNSKAEARLDELLARFVPHPPDDDRVQGLRYQLLTALAGTIKEAQDLDARHAVLMVHEFLTEQRDLEPVVEQHTSDLREFARTLYDREAPAEWRRPWCIELGSEEQIRLYLARAVTDLRPSSLSPSQGG